MSTRQSTQPYNTRQAHQRRTTCAYHVHLVEDEIVGGVFAAGDLKADPSELVAAQAGEAAAGR